MTDYRRRSSCYCSLQGEYGNDEDTRQTGVGSDVGSCNCCLAPSIASSFKTQSLLQVPTAMFLTVRKKTLRSIHTVYVFVCFVWISEQTAIISLYYINWLVFITETECAYCAVQAEAIHYVPPGLTFTNPTFFPHSVFMCLYRSQKKTAIISLYSIDWFL
jgi:hypothetical protein